MSQVRRAKKRPLCNQVNKFISDFTDLIYDGAKIKCLVCNIPLMCWNKYDCKRHVNSAQHAYKKTGLKQNGQFMFDLIFTFIICNLPFNLLDNETFCSFWKKYWDNKLPSRTTIRNYVPSVRDEIENRIKSEIRNKKLWFCVEEMTDRQKNPVVNLIVRTMEPLKPSFSILLASKRVKKRTAETIKSMILSTLEKFELSRNQLLMFVTDGGTTMRSVGRYLKDECGNFLHIICKLHALHLVTETIQKCYPEVDGLIAHTKAVFLKSPKRIREFHRQCPDIPEGPLPILTRWGTWLKEAFYYFQHFQKIKSVVSQFDPEEATAIKESRKKFQDAQVVADLQVIYHNYNGLVEAIEALQNPSLSLLESLQILDIVQIQLHAVSGTKNNSVIAKLDSVLKEDSDLTTLKQICYDCGSTDLLSNNKEYFSYANLTSLDVERSFSAYKNIFSSRRAGFSETTLETHLMLQIFNR